MVELSDGAETRENKESSHYAEYESENLVP